MNRVSLVTVFVPVVAIACCLAIPLLVSGGFGASVLALGLGLPLAAGAVVVAFVVVRRHRIGGSWSSVLGHDRLWATLRTNRREWSTLGLPTHDDERSPDQMTNTLPTPDVLTVYGASWCSDCRNTRRYLDSTGAQYRYVDLQSDVAAQALLDRAGYRSIPVVVTTDGTVLIEPSERELAAVIEIRAA